MARKVLVTGASGFVGRHLVKRLRLAGLTVNPAVRQFRDVLPEGAIAVGSVDGRTDWSAALSDCDAVVHLAGQSPARGIAEAKFTTVNDTGTARLAEQAASHGVLLFIQLSTIFVLTGHASTRPVNDDTLPAPASSYGRSKLAAEHHVERFAQDGRTAVILRAPLIYGAGSPGNWRALQKLAASPWPLPFGSVRNRRSLLSVDNLTDAIFRILSLPIGQVLPGAYCIADSEALSIADMVTALRKGMGRGSRLLPFPTGALAAALRLLRWRTLGESLLGDLVVDDRRFREVFGWRAPQAALAAIADSGAQFAARGRSP